MWTFELTDGEPFCLLLEFQSSVDRWMALRMLIYVTQLFEQALRFHKKPRVLSRIASAVVYNGTRSWTASREFASLRGGDSDDSLSVQFRYLLVDGDGFNERGGLVGLVFALERAGEKDFPGLVRKLAQSLKAPQRAELRRSFEAWLTGVLLPRRLDDGLTAEIESLEDAMIHLPERITWTEEARLAGLAEGRREGMVALARSILEKRFGKLSKRTVQRLRDADTSHLAEWTEKASLCRTLREVFEE